MLLQTVTEDVY